MNVKVCSKCGVERDLTDFRKDSSKKDGLRPDCKVCLKLYEKNIRDTNPDLMKNKLKKFYEKNTNKRKIYRQNYKKRKHQQRKERRETDEIFNLMNRMRCRIWKFIKTLKITKRNKTFEIVGCSPDFLKEHLENQFVEGMTWKNKNEWHIDHIIPLSSAKTEEDLYKLCHYTNLQPLWANDNLQKSNKILEPFNSKIGD